MCFPLHLYSLKFLLKGYIIAHLTTACYSHLVALAFFFYGPITNISSIFILPSVFFLVTVKTKLGIGVFILQAKFMSLVMLSLIPQNSLFFNCFLLPLLHPHGQVHGVIPLPFFILLFLLLLQLLCFVLEQLSPCPQDSWILILCHLLAHPYQTCLLPLMCPCLLFILFLLSPNLLSLSHQTSSQISCYVSSTCFSEFSWT